MPFLNVADGSDALLVELLGFAIRATVLLFGAWLGTKVLHRASAATRHLIWTTAIAGVLMLPLLSAVIPAWNVPVITIAAEVDASLDTPTASLESTRINAEAAQRSPDISISSEPPPAVNPQATLQQRVSAGITPRSVIAVGWFLLAGLMLARLAIANARVSAWQRSSRPMEDNRWLSLLRRLSRQYGIGRPVVLLENPETDVPVTWGIVYPVILLPATAEYWDDEQRIAVLTHELAHVKRFDALSQLLAQLALALLWFHPLVWVAVRRMRLEREHACDDFVLAAGARASRYADDLLGLACRLTRPTAPAAAALAMARRSELEGRLLAILDPAMNRAAVRRARVAVLTAGVLVLAAPLAAFRPAARVAVEATTRLVAQSTDANGITRPQVAPTITARSERVGEMAQLETLIRHADRLSPFTLEKPSAPLLSAVKNRSVPLLTQGRADSVPPIDLETLIDVTKATKKMTSDYEKGQILTRIAKHYQRSDALRDAYLDAVFTMTTDYERSKALIALLERDSLPASSTARVLRSAVAMTSDMNRGMVLKRVSPATFADTTVQRAYLDVIVAMSSNTERASAISSLVKQQPLTQGVQLALLRATSQISSNSDKAGVLLLFLERQGIADEAVRRAFLRSAETLTSDHDYRRVMSAVLR